MSVDYPRAWEIARATRAENHHEDCSFAQTHGAILCDCDVLTEHPEFKDDILQMAAGSTPKGRCRHCGALREAGEMCLCRM